MEKMLKYREEFAKVKTIEAVNGSNWDKQLRVEIYLLYSTWFLKPNLTKLNCKPVNFGRLYFFMAQKKGTNFLIPFNLYLF